VCRQDGNHHREQAHARRCRRARPCSRRAGGDGGGGARFPPRGTRPDRPRDPGLRARGGAGRLRDGRVPSLRP
jgi:hypothetical protein